ncbi:phenoloxidase-activating factor 3-like [Uranotaenia lowii]|uniref:phenoloxidase-activating factor 3-like n=1 Tax=Uranotaenia lowii TaxID=190385 RepID=UPI002478AD48|nr:phenoloxidase-activating factor 3-like [Uranotaenia lowii]
MRLLRLAFLPVLALCLGNPATVDNFAGLLLDYRNSFFSYEQKGLDTCPFTYFRQSCNDFAHVVTIETSSGADSATQPTTFCIGVIFNEQFVLTKANCVPITDDKMHNIKLRTHGDESIAVRSVHRHPDYRSSDFSHNIALLKLNNTLAFNTQLVASCLRVTNSVDLYAKVQEIGFDNIIKSVEQNTTICSGPKRNECLKEASQQWCKKRSPIGFLQIRELGKYKMHPLLSSLDCHDGKIVPISDYLPWIQEVTKSARLEYNLTDIGFGERCVNSQDEFGVCMHIEECPQTLKNIKVLQKNNSLRTCGFDGSNPLTCCVTSDMLKGSSSEVVFRDIVQQIENCEQLYDEFRRTPEEHQLHSYVAVIDQQDSINCSATLIATRFLVTSAQCVLNADPKSASVWTGSAIENAARKMEISSIIIHPKFIPSSNLNNVAIIKLMHPVTVDPFNVPACLWKQKSKLPTTLNVVHFSEPEAQYSKTVANPLYYNDCRMMHNSHLIPSEICVEHVASNQCDPKEDSTGLCQRPGSGLYANIYTGDEFKPVSYVVGLYSKGFKCDKLGPAIYTRISEYYEWIKSVVYLSAQE